MTVVEATSRPQKSATAFRTISEVATDLDVLPHVLRFWESKFPQIKPLKRGGGRRYYRPEDVELLRRIRKLLYRDGYTIKGVQKLLRAPHVKSRAEETDPAAEDDPTESSQGIDDGAMAKEPPSAAMPLGIPSTGIPSSAPAPSTVTIGDPRVPTLALAVAALTVPLDGDARAVLDDIVAELEDVRAMLLASARGALD